MVTRLLWRSRALHFPGRLGPESLNERFLKIEDGVRHLFQNCFLMEVKMDAQMYDIVSIFMETGVKGET